MHSEGMDSLMRERTDFSVGMHLADYHRMVRGEFGVANEVLRQLLTYVETIGTVGVMLSPQTIIFDNFVEEFRSAVNPAKKISSLDQLKIILLRLQDNAGEDFEPSQSQNTIPPALMTRKLGPTIQFQEILQKASSACMANLSGNTGTNDSSSFRMLAKVLTCVGGLEREAIIVLSCQLYTMDMEIHVSSYSSLNVDIHSLSTGPRDDVRNALGQSELFLCLDLLEQF
jgi:hypothetical protein